MSVSSPPKKKIKLEDDNEIPIPTGVQGEEEQESEHLKHDEDDEMEEGDHCSICLQYISDRTVIPACSHEFCFECLLVWTEQSRRCPLCSGAVGEYLIHHIRSKYDYQKHYLAPLRTSPPSGAQRVSEARRNRAVRRLVVWGRRERREREAADELERAIEKRRWVYRHSLYAKHVASNSYTRFRPFPTPAQFSANQELITRATVFIRRELRVWDSLDVEFLTTFTISLMKSLDIRSEPAVKLLAEFLDMDAEYDSANPRANAEHFAHELYSYLRSPFRELSVYDSVVQYDTPSNLPPLHEASRGRKWGSRSRSRSPPSEPGPSRPRGYSSAQERITQSRSRSASREGSTKKSSRRARSHSTDYDRKVRCSESSQERRTEAHRYVRHSKSPSVDRVRTSHRRERRSESRARADRDLRRHRRASPSDDELLPNLQDEERRCWVDAPVRRDTGDAKATGKLAIDEDLSSKAKSDIKGKGRALDQLSSPAAECRHSCTSLSREQIHLPIRQPVSRQGDEAAADDVADDAVRSDIEPETAKTSRVPQRIRPRIKPDAWQAIQAHLVGSRAESYTRPAIEVRLSQPELIIRGASSNPLSNVAILPHDVIVSSTSQTPPSESTWQPSALTPTEPPTIVSGTPAIIETPRENAGATGMSSREIMARTRAKLVRMKQKSEAAAKVESNALDLWNDNPSSEPLTSSHSAAHVAKGDAANINIAAVQSSASAGSNVNTHISISPPPLGVQTPAADQRAVDIRVKLLSKLEEEKRVQATSPNSTGVNGDIHTHTVSGGGRQSSISTVNLTADRASKSTSLGSTAIARRNAELMESKLRAQAQLRVKLAAAKRQAEREQLNEKLT